MIPAGVLNQGALPTHIVAYGSSVYVGKSYLIAIYLYYSDGSLERIDNALATYSRSNTNVTVSGTGLVTGVSEGSTTITVTYLGFSSSFVTNVTLNKISALRLTAHNNNNAITSFNLSSTNWTTSPLRVKAVWLDGTITTLNTNNNSFTITPQSQGGTFWYFESGGLNLTGRASGASPGAYVYAFTYTGSEPSIAPLLNITLNYS